MILAHKIALDPTVKQAAAFTKAAGTARYTWNWALAECQKTYKETGKSANIFDLAKRWNKEKPEWVYESPKDANQRPFTNLRKAYSSFFKKKARHPKFKKKGQRDSFYVSNDQISINAKRVRLPRIGSIKMTKELRLIGKIMGAVVSRTAGRWFVSIQVEMIDGASVPAPNQVVGIDLGVKHVATCSDGKVFDAPRPLRTNLKKMARLQRTVSRRVKGSKRREKAKFKVAKLHYKISNIRKDFLHKTTTQLCRENQTIVLEDLSVKGMMSRHTLARAISDVGMYEFRRHIEYKQKINGHAAVFADRFYPSSKTCSGCGHIKSSLNLSDRIYSCLKCGLEIDRDLNAALNLRTLGLRGINARGQEGSAEPQGEVTILDETRTKPEDIHHAPTN